MVVVDTGPAVAPVVQGCVDVLVQRIQLAKDRVHKNHGERQIRRAKEELSATPDFRAARDAVAKQDYEAFVNALDGAPDAVEAEIGRRLKYHPEAEALLEDAFVIQDLVENVLLWGYRHFVTRPENVPLRDWLFGAIDPAIDEVVRAVQQSRAAA
jgi:hypothetical protein